MHEHTVNRLAEMFEKDRATLARALRGFPPDGGTTKRPLYRVATAFNALIAHEAKPDGRHGSGAVAQLAAERARLAKEQADRVARMNAMERRQVVRTEPITRFLQSMLLAVRERLLGLAGQHAYALAMQPQEVCFRILDDAVRDKLNELADPRTAAADAVAAGFADVLAETHENGDGKNEIDAPRRDNYHHSRTDHGEM